MTQSLPLSGIPPLRCSAMEAEPETPEEAADPRRPRTFTRCVRVAKLARVCPLSDGSNGFRLQAWCSECWESFQRVVAQAKDPNQVNY